MKPGLHFAQGGAAFSVYSATATSIEFCLFNGNTETQRIALSREGDWHNGFLTGVKPGARYGLRAHGPEALGFDASKLLLDPYAAHLDTTFEFDARLADRSFDTSTLVPKAVATHPLTEMALRTPHEPRLIYELQVRSFTKLHPEIPDADRGTVRALTHSSVIAHLKKIGVDTIELMPITAWITERHLAKIGLRNGWGYNPVSFFAPEPRLVPGGMEELRVVVAELHRHGFNVILDMVFNHSGEGDAAGPTLSFRGLDNQSYYAHHDGQLINDTGCGNTFALNREPMLSLVLDSLRHWVLQAGIDGFRFDLASILGRTETGFDPQAPLLKAIEADPILSTRIMIAEPWDVGPGGYQLGNFPPSWYEWNDKYRDDTRRFWRGEDYSANAMATRIAGSSDIFARKGSTSKSINFVAAHDGFTLHDLTKYMQKNNLANGEENRDGKSDEVTCPNATSQSLLASLLFSQGVAMITAGDEFGRTQQGNNNAYCQDNALTWLDWKNMDNDLVEAFARLMAKRNSKPITNDFLNASQTRWLDGSGQPIDWTAPKNQVIRLQSSARASLSLDSSKFNYKIGE
jgi:glycogen debranching enzyme